MWAGEKLELKLILEGGRIFLSIAFLLYASWSDFKTREVSNKTWILLAPSTFILTFLQILIYEPSNLTFYGLSFAITAAFAIILFYFGGFGGADAKALMCLALAMPFYPQNLFVPLSGEISPISQSFFPLTVFSNSVLLAALTSVYMLLRNIFWHRKTGIKLFEKDHENESLGKKILVLITGYKVSVKKLKEEWHLYPLEEIENFEDKFKRKLIISTAIPKDEDRNITVKRLEKAVENGIIQDMIWATPGLPMLIFITAGLLTALIFGDIIWICIRFLLG